MAVVRVRQPQVVVVAPASTLGRSGEGRADTPTPSTSITSIATPAAGSTTVESKPDPIFVVVALLIVGVVWFVAFQWNPLVWTYAKAATLAAGISVFALLYIVAQALERLLEPLSSLDPSAPAAEETRDQTVAAAVADPTAGLLEAAANAQAGLERVRKNKAVIFWGLATVAGMFMSAFTGIYLLDIVIETPNPPPSLDILVTGLVVGGGTKPLHDLIARIETAKDDANDPEETKA
jgi:hypothetical protein